jgi:hypothetical protein
MHTEALRSFVMRVAAEADAMPAEPSRHGRFLMNFSADVIQRVCEANLEIHERADDGAARAAADKLVRDAIIWTHIAGDAVQRMSAVRRTLN